jgi:plasmid stabilization system protein ParE
MVAAKSPREVSVVVDVSAAASEYEALADAIRAIVAKPTRFTVGESGHEGVRFVRPSPPQGQDR